MPLRSVVQILPKMELGGVERGVVELSQQLVQNGIASHVISTGGELVQQLLAQGGQHTPFDCASKNLLTAPVRSWQLKKILHKINPSIIHVRSRVPAWLLRLGNVAARYKIVSTCHGLYSVNFYSAQMTKADRVICPSRSMIDYVKNNYGVEVSRLRLIHRGVDFAYFDADKIDHAICQSLVEKHGLQGKTVFAIVGRASAIKGQRLFLQAFAKAMAGDKNAVALVVGECNKQSSAWQAMQTLVQQLNLQNKVVYTGTVRTMRELYAVADYVVSASLKPEAFGRTVAEALAIGCPVVAPRHGGALDIVAEGTNGLLFLPNDVADLARCLQQVQALPKIDFRQTVQSFSLKRMTEQTLSVYRELSD